MKKWVRVSLAFVVSVLIYIGFYYLIVEGSTQENYYSFTSTYFLSIIFSVLGILVCFISTKIFNKKISEDGKKYLLITMLAVIWGALFGWITLTGFMIGGLMAGWDKKNGGINEKKKMLYPDLNNLTTSNFLIAFVIILPIIAIHFAFLVLFPSNFEDISGTSSVVLIAPLLFLALGYIQERKSNKGKMTNFQKAILYIMIFFVLLHLVFFAISVLTIPANSQDKEAFYIEDKYLNSMAYYNSKIIPLNDNIKEALLKENFEDIDSKTVEEYILYKEEQGRFIVSLCDEVKNKSIDLNNYPKLWELNIFCKWEKVTSDCTEESGDDIRKMVDFFKNVNNKDYESCLDVFHPARKPGNCDFLNNQFGYDGQVTDSFEAEAICKDMFPNNAGNS